MSSTGNKSIQTWRKHHLCSGNQTESVVANGTLEQIHSDRDEIDNTIGQILKSIGFEYMRIRNLGDPSGCNSDLLNESPARSL